MDFSLLETMRLEGGAIVRRDRHVARAEAAAATLGFAWDARETAAALDDAEANHAGGVWRSRLLVTREGRASVECMPLVHDASKVWRVALGATRVASGDPALRVKTTRRQLYERAKAARPDVDDVLLWNEHGEVTESTIANVVAEIDNTWYTPPVSCGLLPGVFRAEVIGAGMVREREIHKVDIHRATRVWLINSLREWMKAALVP